MNRIGYPVNDFDFWINLFLRFLFRYFQSISSFFSESVYIDSNVNCLLNSSCISWFHDWCIDRALAIFFFWNKYFHFLYVCDILVCKSEYFFRISEITEDVWLSSLTLANWCYWLLQLSAELNFFLKTFLFEVEISHISAAVQCCFSSIINCCWCVDLMMMMQSHLLNFISQVFQLILRLCFFNQGIFNTTSWLIIITMSKIIVLWCC